MRKIVYLLLLAFAVFSHTSLLAQRKKKDKKTESMLSQAKDDVLTLPGNQTPYKAKFYEALRLKMVGDYNGAVALFEECHRMNENDDAVLFVLAEFYAGSRQFTKAKSFVSQAYKIDPTNTWYLELLAFIQQNLGLYEEAEISFKQLVEYEPHNMDWLYYYSEAQLYNGNFKGALQTFDRLLEEAGPVPQLLYRKIELLIDQGQNEQVIAELKVLIEDYPDTPDYLDMLMDYYASNNLLDESKLYLETLIKNNPTNPYFQLAMADFYNKTGNRKNTYTYLKNAFHSSDLEIDEKVKLLIGIHDNQFPIDSEAFELLDILIEKHGADAKSYSIQGDFYLKNDDNTNALSAFRKALVYDKTKYPIWHETLVLEYSLGNYPELYEQGKTALEYFPSVANVYLFTGLGALHTNKLEEAVEYLTIGKDFVIKDPLLVAEFNFQLAETFMQLKKYDRALFFYKDALKSDPTNALYLNNFAYRLAVHGVYLDMAFDAIDRANVISPNQPNFLDTYAWVLFKQKKYYLALEKIKQAFELAPNSPVVAEHYGDILFNLGEQQQGIEFWLTSQRLGNTTELLELKINTKKYHERKP